MEEPSHRPLHSTPMLPYAKLLKSEMPLAHGMLSGSLPGCTYTTPSTNRATKAKILNYLDKFSNYFSFFRFCM